MGSIAPTKRGQIKDKKRRKQLIVRILRDERILRKEL
jgi:hypothetical protein